LKRSKIIWTICNATTDAQGIKFILETNWLPRLCIALESTDSRIIYICLEALEAILNSYEPDPSCDSAFNPNALKLVECFPLEKLKKLQFEAKSEMRDKVTQIVNHFGPDYELYLARQRGLLTKRARNK
jgi:hypothetical protein